MTEVGTNGLSGCSYLPPKTTLVGGQLGIKITKDEVLTPNFADKTLNSGDTAELSEFFRLQAETGCYRVNVNFDVSQHVAGEENPFYPEGFRLFDFNLEGRNLWDKHLNFRLGRLSVIAGSTFGLIDGGEARLHSSDNELSLSLFAGFLAESITQNPTGRTTWGSNIHAALGKTSTNFSVHQVFDDQGDLKRTRLTLNALNNSWARGEFRGGLEYDPLLNKVPRAFLSGDIKLSRGWTLGALGQRRDPAFDIGSFFNLIPTEPNYSYFLMANYKKDKFSASLNGGQIFYAYHFLTDLSADLTFHGFNLGGSLQFGTEDSDPHFSYTEGHAGYSVKIKDRASLGISGNLYYFEYLDGGKLAYSVGPFARAEVFHNFLLSFSAVVRQNAEGKFDPLGYLSATYFFEHLFTRGAK